MWRLRGLSWSPWRGGKGELKVYTRTVAELSVAIGYHPASGADTTARDIEIMHENAWLSHDLVRYTTHRVGTSEQPWSFVLSNPVLAEELL